MTTIAVTTIAITLCFQKLEEEGGRESPYLVCVQPILYQLQKEFIFKEFIFNEFIFKEFIFKEFILELILKS